MNDSQIIFLTSVHAGIHLPFSFFDQVSEKLLRVSYDNRISNLPESPVGRFFFQGIKYHAPRQWEGF
jgi:hypothetical protein